MKMIVILISSEFVMVLSNGGEQLNIINKKKNPPSFPIIIYK